MMRLFGSRTGDTSAGELRRQLLLWFAALGGAVAWSLHLLLIYGFQSVACALGTALAIHLLTVALAAIAAASVYVSIGIWRDASGSAARRWVGLASLLLNAIFLFSIVVQGLPALIVDPCI